jgi:HEAT repeat protein
VPEALSRLIASCLERQIADRCASVDALLAELEAVKREQALDDDAILAAVIADAGAVPPPRPEPTRDRLAGPLPRDQGAGVADRGVRPAPRSRARIGWYAIAGVVVVAGAAYGALGQGRELASARVAGANEPAAPALVGSTAVRSIKDAFLAGDAPGGRALAEDDLHRAIASGTLQQQGFAVDALAAARVPAGAPLLYAALQAAPDVRVKAARALGELALPDAAPRLRAALAGSGDTVKVELAAVLFRLGDKDARAILLRATENPIMRLTAATAMAESADDGGRAALSDVLATTPHGRDPWRRAAGGLMALGDANARTLLEGELAQPDATRAVGAAELLARAGDPRAREVLARLVADKQLTRAGDAALALARLGDKRALAWVGDGLTSRDGDERKLALAVCGVLAADAAPHTGAIARLATDDPVLSVRMTAEAVLLGL